MRYVSDIIGEDEFKSWGPGQRVFITAATGTGKTTFILDKLLIERVIEHSIERKKEKKILYLVNRRILKEQLIKDLESDIWDKARERYGDMINIYNYIRIMTYQSIEKMIQHDPCGLKNSLDGFDIVVYDECHYIYTDSNFNRHTELSYDLLRRLFDKKIQIFISATMEKVRSCIEEYDKKYFLKELFYMKCQTKDEPYFSAYYAMCRYVKRKPDDKEFSIEQDYSYVRLNVFETYENLADIISENMKEKWIVFADSIEKGENLKKQIYEKIEEKKDSKEKDNGKTDIVFVDSQFKNKEDSGEAVEDIIKYKKSKKGILIVTSVMNNGISIVDEELKNIAILYDTKEEFIQMLGRKRRDNEDDDASINLYVCKRNSNHFRLRKEGVKRKLRFYYDHQNNIEDMYKRLVYNTACPNDCKECTHIYDVTPLFDLLYMIKHFTSDGNITVFNPPNIFHLQQKVLADILDKNINNQIFYSLNGLIAVNYFSINRLIHLERFYHDMETEMKNDEYAFVREQMKWMGMKNDEFNENITETERKLNEKYLNILRENIEQILDKELDTKENIRLKKGISDALIHFICKNKKDEEKENIKNNCKKYDRPVSKNDFEECMKNAGLSYKMIKPTQSTYLVSRREE